MGNTQENISVSYFENEYQEQFQQNEESNLNSQFIEAYNNQFGKFDKDEENINTFEKSDIKNNKEKEPEQKNERNDFVKSKGNSVIDINKDKKYKILEKYNKEKIEKNSSSIQKTESSTQLNKDEETENKKDSNENNNKNVELINIDKQIENINIEESEEIESKINNNNDTININTPNIPEKNSEDTNLNKKRNRDKNINNKKINFDKIIRRIKMSILDAIIRFINHKIEIDNNYDNVKGIILSINKKELSHSNVEENKKFLKKNLEEILTTNISKKYTNYIPTHNIELIQDLKINKGEDYKKIFELTFLDCIEHIRETKNIDILDGLDKIDDIIKIEEQKMDKDEIENFVDFIMDYENILDGKEGRNSKKQKMNNQL